ncbi:MAG: phosphoribosylglycinamide formyltransferase [Chromatiales bacterium]|nr:phosphoribosylglycinamide formyltransferase [Chromatiales bacterium]
MHVHRLKLGFLASGGGSNVGAILAACDRGDLSATPAALISNNSQSGAMDLARKAGLANFHVSGKTHPDESERDDAIVEALTSHDVSLVVLGGYMKKLGPRTLSQFTGRIVNVHPSLLPRHGGHGMYGIRVHEAVLATGDARSGASIHVVDGDYDTGPVIAQMSCEVLIDDTPQSLAARVLRLEHQLFWQTLESICAGEMRLPGLSGEG